MKHQACLTDNVQLKRIGGLTQTKELNDETCFPYLASLSIVTRTGFLVQNMSSQENWTGLNTTCIFILFYLALPQGQGHHNSVSQLLWARSTYPTLSTFPVGGNRSTQRKPTTFGRALTLLFSREDSARVHHIEDRTRNLRGEMRVV